MELGMKEERLCDQGYREACQADRRDASVMMDRQPTATTPPARRGRRILLHDYGGYAFPVELARWLAGQGHEVLHLYSADVEAPRGRLHRLPDDPPGFSVEAVSSGRELPKYALLRRWLQEMDYGTRLARRAVAFHPDVVLSTNTPPAVQARLSKELDRCGVPLLCWVQDIFTIGAAELLKAAPAPLRWAVGRFLERIEFGVMRRAAGLIVISDDFLDTLARYGVRHPRSAVVENWAPLGDIRRLAKDNAWARTHGLADRFVFLCAGTLGKKHNPAHLAALAHAFRDDPMVRVVVISQGPGRRWLEDVKRTEELDNLLLLDFQPFEVLPEILATGDVGVVVLETYAGNLSVPSKIYSHFCAARPILAAIPPGNLGRRRIEEVRAGLCADPGDTGAFIAAAQRLRADSALRDACAGRQTAYAQEAFDIARIGARFEDLLEEACQGASASSGRRDA